jgi:hypothetical protein
MNADGGLRCATRRADFGVALTLSGARARRRSPRGVGVAQENFKKSTSKRITTVDNAIIAS